MEWDTVGWPSKPQNSVQTRYLRLKRVGCGTRWWRAWQRVTSFAYDSSVDPWRCLCCEDATSSVHLLFESFPFFPPSRMQIRHRAMTGKWVAGWTGGWLGGGRVPGFSFSLIGASVCKFVIGGGAPCTSPETYWSLRKRTKNYNEKWRPQIRRCILFFSMFQK